MMRQTLAIFHDSYRELNSRKLFWISIILSGLLVAAFAATGIGPKGITFFTWVLPFPINSNFLAPEVFYKMMFLNVGVKFWLTWGAMILALVSTASVIPEFVASGSIELSLSRPISRVRIFLTKYCASLLFAGLQVSAFSLACFLVIGLRGHAWEPRLFLAIPLVLLVFSYLYCISAIVGLMTRSTIFSLIAACIFWLFLFMLNLADTGTLAFKQQTEVQVLRAEKTMPAMEKYARNTVKAQIESGAVPPQIPEYSAAAKAGNPTDEDLAKANPILAKKQIDLAELKKTSESIAKWNKGFYIAKTLLPKTGETADLLGRSLLSPEDVKRLRLGDEADAPEPVVDETPTDGSTSNQTREERRAQRHEMEGQAAIKTDEELRSRSLWYVIGGSLAFEAVILFLATWIFCRRDF